MARIIDSIVGHQIQIKKLFHLKDSDRWPHAMIFVGPSGTGKKKMALGFAQALVCKIEDHACGSCGACLRIEKMQSENLFILEPDIELAKPLIKVEQIRDLLHSLSLASLGAARVVIIDEAQTLNPQASNALLKTLEEPTENIFFILIANDDKQLLSTIRSRSQVMRFSGLSYDEVKTVKPGLAD